MAHTPRPPRHLRVFLSSPGDVAEERRLARQVLERLPRRPLLRGKITLEVVSWDDPDAPTPMLANLTPQDAVNRGSPTPAICDLTVVILWGRMGTPLAKPRKNDGSAYLSGTEWEYENAAEANRDILLYRRSPPAPIDVDDPDAEQKRHQRQLVHQFFSRFTNADGSLAGGFTSYASDSEFENRLERDVETLLGRWLNAGESDQAVTQPVDRGTSTPVAAVDKSVDDQPKADAAPSQIFGFLTASGPAAGLPLLIISCVVVENPDTTRQAVTNLLADLRHDPKLRDNAEVVALRRRPFDYRLEDPEVRQRFIAALLQLSFEAYVWFARPADSASESDLLRRLASGLLRDRLTADRKRSFVLSIDRRLEPYVDELRTVLSASAQDIRASDKRGVHDPSVVIADALEPCVAVAHYVAAIVGRLHDSTPLDVRTSRVFTPRRFASCTSSARKPFTIAGIFSAEACHSPTSESLGFPIVLSARH